MSDITKGIPPCFNAQFSAYQSERYVVSVHDNGPRVNWRLAVMTKLLVGGDGLTHAVEIRTSTGTTNRPITKLYPLEVNSSTDLTDKMPGEQEKSTAKKYSQSTNGR